MNPTSWNSIPRVFFRLAPTGKVEKTSFQGEWTTFVNPPFCTACKGPAKMLVWNRPRGIRSQGCFFVSSRWENSTKRVFNPIGRTSSSRRFPLLGKAHPKWWYETDLVEFDPKGAFSFRPDGECRINQFWKQLDDLRQPGVFRCLVKPTQNGGMKPTSWNSIPRVLFRFAPMGNLDKTSFKRNGTTFVNTEFCAAGKSPPKMVVWNRPRVIWSKGCFFVSPQWGKSKKRIFNAIGRPTSNWRFALLGKSHPKWWYETDLVEFDPKGDFSFHPYGKSPKNEFWTQLDDLRQPGFLRCWEKPTQNVVSNRPRGIRSKGCFFLSPIWGNSKKRVFNAIGRFSSTRRFPLLGKALPKWWYDNELVEFDPRVFFRFAPMGKVEKTSFERNWTTFVNPAFCAAGKSPPKMVVWNRPRGIRSKGCFFVSPRLGKSNKFVLNAIGRRSSTQLFALLGKAHSKWWYETDPMEFDPKGVFSFRPHGENRKNAFWAQLDDVRHPGFLPCLEKPTQNGGMKPTS